MNNDVLSALVAGLRSGETRPAERRAADAIDALCDLRDIGLRFLNAPERTLTPAERAVWGTCPVCGAKDGDACCMDGPVPIGATYADFFGPHPARLAAAPLRVRMVPTNEISNNNNGKRDNEEKE